MQNLFDWIDDLSKPADDPALKEIEEQRKMLESLRRGDYLETIAPEDTPLGRIEEALRRVADMSEKRCKLAEEESKSAKKEARKATIRTWISIAIAISAAVIAVLAWIFPR